MQIKYNLKNKGADGRYFTFGNVSPREKGPRCGLKVSPELRALINAKQDGDWVNFLMFPDDRQQAAALPPRTAPALDDDAPF